MNTTTRRPLLHAAICLLVLSTGCGGEESDSADQTADTRPDTFATSEDESLDDAPQPAPTVESEPVEVQLGGRFIWCSQVQATWERHDNALAALTAARSALETAADGLSRAEAREALEDAEGDYNRQSALVVYDDNLPYLLDRTRISASNHQDDTKGIAYSLAWEALAAANPDIANAINHAWSGDAGQAYAASVNWNAIYEASLSYLNGFVGWPNPDFPAEVATSHADQLSEAFRPSRARQDHGVGMTVREYPMIVEANDAARHAIAVISQSEAYQDYQAAYDAVDAALAELVQGSAAYLAFKESFQESCQ